MSSAADPGESAGQLARDRIRQERDSVRGVRTQRFLVAQTTILAIAFLLVLASNLTGAMESIVVVQSFVFCGIVGLATLAGWWAHRTQGATTGLVVALLHADSVLGLVFFYIAGEFETPALAILYLCVVMAPIFAGRGHAWRIGATQWLGYSLLLAYRFLCYSNELSSVLPYGYMLPADAVNEPAYVLDCWVNFTIGVWGITYLAGQASIDIVNSQKQLEDEVANKTEELAHANRDLAAANGRLEQSSHALSRKNEELERTNARLEQFNHAVSHDLRSPLQTVLLRAEMVAALLPDSPDDAAKQAEAVADAVVRMSELVDELLKLTHIDGRQEGLQRVRLDAVVDQACQDLASRTQKAGGRVELRAPLGTVAGNPTLLRELFQNLIDNGVKYGEAGAPVVHVEASDAPEGRIAVAVEDNGTGIPADEREQVFQLFRRMRQHSGHEGMGAGLALVTRIVEVHGGTVRIEEPLELSGARFVVELPDE